MTGGAPRVGYESRSVCFVRPYRQVNGDTWGPADATGFHWKHGPKLYFITNWHCVTGLHADSHKPIGTFIPTHLQCWFHEIGETTQHGVRQTKWLGKCLSLYEEGQPIWLEHPKGSNVDLVAIPITNYEWEGRIHTANGRQEVAGYNPMCGDDCYIVGYPDGFTGPIGTPIWKRASIASEPELDYDNKPMFLADSMTRPGMSGSPVFARIPGLWGQEGAQMSIENGPSVLGYWSKFIGVYAGREGDDKIGFQLARIWKSEAIEEIIRHNRRALRPAAIF